MSPIPVQMDSPSHFSNLLSPSNTVQFKSRKPSKRTEATKSINVKKLAKSMDQSIATTEDVNNHKQSEQHLSSPASGDVPAGIVSMPVSMLSPAPVLYSVPILEAAGDAFESNIISSKQVRTEEAKVNDHVAEECPRDNFNGFQQKDETNPGLSEVMDMFAENGSTEEVSSSACNSALVSVGGYKVKKVAATMLRNIIEKHGDIAVNCSATTVAGRSMFLQSICDIMQTLEASKAVDIKESEIEDMLDMVEELAKHKLQVGWLKKRLDEILNAIKAIKSYPDLRNAKAANTKSIQESENSLKCYKNVIQLHKAKIQESEFTIKLFERKVVLEQEKLGMMRAESEGIKDRVSSLQSMVKILTKGTLIQDLH